jgi:hypothetical protein
MNLEEANIENVEGEDVGEWVIINNHPDFEIYSQYPFQIRNRITGKFIKISISKSLGYNVCHLTNNEKILQHRIIALQFIPNPERLPFIDHIDRNRQNNHIQNLRWVSYSDNCKNRTGAKNVTYELIDELPRDCFVVGNYGNHLFDNLHYSPENDRFYLFTGVNYRVLPILENSRDHCWFVCVIDTNRVKTKISLIKFKRLYNIL